MFKLINIEDLLKLGIIILNGKKNMIQKCKKNTCSKIFAHEETYSHKNTHKIITNQNHITICYLTGAGLQPYCIGKGMTLT